MVSASVDDGTRARLEGEWRRYARELTHRHALLLVAGTTLINTLFWFTDATVFSELPDVLEQYAFWRPVLIAEGIVFGLALYVLRRPSPLLIFLGFAAAVATLSMAFSRSGPPSTPFVQFLHLVPLATIAFSGPLPLRLLTVVSLGVIQMGTYFAFTPGHLEDPYAATTIAFHGFALAMGVVAGWRADAFRRTNFLLTRRLAETNETLESRVRQRTDELRRLVTRAEAMRERERADIARDLHDELGQELTALRLALDVTRRRWARDPTTVGANLDLVATLLERTRQSTRALARELRPQVLDDLGLGPALVWLAGRAEDRSGIAFSLNIDDRLPAMSPETATSAYRIAQEALSNALRHAQATRLSLTLTASDERLELLVADDGRGFDQATTGHGLGIVGMRERAESVGGRLVIGPGRAGGTEVRAFIPLGAAKRKEAA